ncbi:MAG: hypothetical protein OEW77_08540 [Gemmatimonadota bacterium]|nr:hypothetical protein [Gemmatimonadota bacterium]
MTGLIDRVRRSTSPAPVVAVYSGSRGLVIDTRPIFKRGRRPTKVEVSFPDHARLDRTADVDPLTNIATVSFENDSLTAAESAALDKQVEVRIVVTGDDATPVMAPGIRSATTTSSARIVLGDMTGMQSVDATNRPVEVDNASLGGVSRGVVLAENTPYLLVLEGFEMLPTIDINAVVKLRAFGFHYGTTAAGDSLDDGARRRRQGFSFHPVAGKANTYRIKNNSADPFGDYLAEAPVTAAGGLFYDLLLYGGERQPFADTQDTTEFQLVPDSADGSVRIRVWGTERYVRVAPNSVHHLRTDVGVGTKIWLRAGDTEWTIRGLGTAFSQPIMPPAEVAFASTSTIVNCSMATVNESLGRTQTRTITRSNTRSESIQLVSESAQSYSHTMTFDLELRVEPFKDNGTGVGTNFGWSDDWTSTYSTTRMHDSTKTQTDEESESVEITRTRDVTVPPYEAVSATDWVRTVPNVTVPWTQRSRIEGRNPRSGRSLTGEEIVSQLVFAKHRGLITAVGATFVEFTERGSTTVNNFYETQSTVRDIPNACR